MEKPAACGRRGVSIAPAEADAIQLAARLPNNSSQHGSGEYNYTRPFLLKLKCELSSS